MENKKGVSMIVLVITVIVILIISGTVILNLSDQKISESSKLASLQSDMQLMLDQYEVKYNELLVKYKGDTSKFTTEDIEELQSTIPEEYQATYRATTGGIEYIGTDEEERK